MMTMRERIARAAMSMYERVYGDSVPWSQDYGAQRLMMGRVEEVLKDAFPEFFSDPPTAWLAPIDATAAMAAAEFQVEQGDLVPGMLTDTQRQWDIYRDAYLKDGA